MKKLAYLDCPTGIAGDMCLGALVDAGVPLPYLIKTLGQLGIEDEYELQAETVRRNGQAAIKIHVHLISVRTGTAHQHNSTRHLPEIEQMIQKADLPTRATAWSLAVFRRLAEAEGAVHGIPADKVHFHEVGATDAIVDIVGTCLGLDWLKIDHLYCSALPTGGGVIRAAHGQLPVPAPAVLKLFEIRQVPIYSNGIQRELVTPTGAAIATALAVDFGPPPAMRLQRVGLGAGGRELALPNMVRLWIGEGEGEGGSGGDRGDREDGGAGGAGEEDLETHHHASRDGENGEEQIENRKSKVQDSSPAQSPLIEEPITVLQTQVDDLNPQAIGYLFDRLFEVGAVDVFTQPVGMKKSRPGFLLTVLCHPPQADCCETVLFRETTTLGVRRSLQQRHILHREMQTVQTPYGEVHIKVARQSQQGPILNVHPEYEDCAALAQQHHLPWREVHWTALQVWRQTRQLFNS
ncbi:MAG: nickel pincer cofactor biosynthesis protein LarC [Leptolyngbyaceae cyanobacterium MO_188.B28]|nr:nickel pincer cofactor biosynthesis protein LarC [Leptolyngbyaceae cyanobacterium MO_188.B28]